jgi:hypothetical protein
VNPPVELGYDPDRKVSSQPPYKTGVNRGKRKREVGGRWDYVTGYDHENSSQIIGSTHWVWARKLQSLGVRVGATYDGGCTGFFVWVSDVQSSPSRDILGI